MSSETLKAVLEVLKLAPRYLVALGIASAFFLFASEKVLKYLGVLDFAQNFRAVFSVTLILTGLLFIIDRAVAIWGWMRHGKLVRKTSKASLERLHRLTEDEKQIIRFYLAKATKTNYLRIDDGVVYGLEAAKIIYRASQTGDIIEGFAYNISEASLGLLAQERMAFGWNNKPFPNRQARAFWALTNGNSVLAFIDPLHPPGLIRGTEG